MYKIQYATCTEDLEEAIDALKELSPEYFEQRVEGLLTRKEEWVQLFRAHLSIGGHHTNNFAEATVRILKDVILQRTKAFNAAALVDYIAEGWETYLQTRLLRFAYKKNKKSYLLYNDMVKRMPPELGEKISVVDEDTYIVPSAVTGEETYEVTASTGTCLCKAGAAGAFCKHQALVHEKFGTLFPNQPLLSSADRYLMGQLALGEKCPEKEYFLDPKETIENLEEDLEKLMKLHSPDSPPDSGIAVAPCLRPFDSPEAEPEEDEDIPAESTLNEFLENWKRIFTLGTETNPNKFLKFMKNANADMGKVTNQNLAFVAMMRAAAAMKGTKPRFGRKIKTQPTSRGRRRPGVTKGASRVASGRPPTSLSAARKHPVRVRKLAASVAANKSHIKKH